MHTDKVFRVVGRLEPSGTVLDQLLHCTVSTIWEVHEGHGEAVAPEDREITAVLLKKRNPLAVLTIPNTIRETNMQVALPSIEINRLTQNFGIGMNTLRAIALLIMLISFASIFISVYDNLLARRYELALMRTMGGSRGGLFLLLLLEGGLLSTGGSILGLVLSRLGLVALAQLVEDKFRYDWSNIGVMPEELVLVGLAIFVGLIAASSSWASPRMDKNETAALRAIAVYALYRVHGSVRHGANRADAPDIFRGFIRQATERHAKSCSLVSLAFKRPREETASHENLRLSVRTRLG